MSFLNEALAYRGFGTRSLMMAGSSGRMFGPASGSAAVIVYSTLLPADTIKGGATIFLEGLLAKYSPFAAGTSISVRLGGVLIANTSLVASVANYHFRQSVQISDDRKWGFSQSLTIHGIIGSAATATGYPDTGTQVASAPASTGARSVASSAKFVTYTAPPTVETVDVDFTQPQLLTVTLTLQNGDSAEFTGFSADMRYDPTGRSFASPKATIIYGDSLTEGTGSSAVSSAPQDVGSQLARLRAGTPLASAGLGGQKSLAIVNRLLDDAVKGKQWNAIFWTGTNDFDSNIGDGPGWLAAITSQIDRALAFRTNPNWMMLNMYPRSTWAVGDANYTAMQFVNAGLGTKYGASRVVDIFTVLATNAGQTEVADRSDAIHLVNSGYAKVAAAVDAKMTALGW